MRAAIVTVLAVFIIMSALSGVTHAYAVTRFLYTLNPDGTADVKVFVTSITSDETEVVVAADSGIIGSSVRAYDSSGNLYPTDVTDHSVIVYTTGSIDYLTIEYTAVVGVATGSVVNVTIAPSAPATVELPSGSSLIAFNGTPEINVVNNKLVLEYGQGGIYYIVFTNPSPPVTTTTTTTATTVTTTTTPAQTTTTTTTTTTTATTTTSPSQTTTHQPTTTTTASPGGAGTATTTTTQVTETTTTTATTAATTTASTTTTTTTTTTTATQPSGGGGINTVVIGAAVALAAIVIAALFFLRRGGRGAGPGPSGGSAAVIAEELDDRDKAILEAVSGGGKSISDLARELGLSKSVVWRRINKLVEFGLLRRIQDKSGKVILELTDKGREVLG